MFVTINDAGRDPASPTAIENGERAFLSQLSTIDRVIAFICSRHHLDAAEADDFASHARMKLIEDEYRLLRKFEGRSSLSTYLTVVIHRLFLDYRTAAWGKWRPSAEARRHGPAGVLLERLINRDGYTLGEAFEIMTTNHQLQLTRREYELLASRIAARPRRVFEGVEALENVHATSRPTDGLLSDNEHRQMGRHVWATLQAAIAKLDTDDRVVLTMRFEDGRTVADIARARHIDQKALYRRIERLLRGLRRELIAAGIDGNVVADLTPQDGHWSSSTGHHGEFSRVRPSIGRGTGRDS